MNAINFKFLELLNWTILNVKNYFFEHIFKKKQIIYTYYFFYVLIYGSISVIKIIRLKLSIVFNLIIILISNNNNKLTLHILTLYNGSYLPISCHNIFLIFGQTQWAKLCCTTVITSIIIIIIIIKFYFYQNENENENTNTNSNNSSRKLLKL